MAIRVLEAAMIGNADRVFRRFNPRDRVLASDRLYPYTISADQNRIGGDHFVRKRRATH
jgi:hypothetical protein